MMMIDDDENEIVCSSFSFCAPFVLLLCSFCACKKKTKKFSSKHHRVLDFLMHEGKYIIFFRERKEKKEREERKREKQKKSRERRAVVTQICYFIY